MSSEISFASVFADAGADYEKLREISDDLVPFGKHAGIEITEVGPDRAVAEIPGKPHQANHLGTVHAGALFLAADIAGAAAFVGAAAPVLSNVDILVLRNAGASFRKPATGRIRAIATVDEREMRRVLAADGAQRFDLDGKAQLFDSAGVMVAKFTFEYVCTMV
ncbi:PaaI family thioesterase [Amycolatopsis acididurans]|uniref:PaaI family thioesterase n=1 Tax=Amycolatopsis acididurans TaxID=2724524 RepID=UPI001B340654|nr:PaaI family thioesterase [Amycolatopsis acididurans]